MNKIICFVLCIMIFFSCNHRIVKTGYAIEETVNENCNIVIKKDFLLNDLLASKIGEIKLGEAGLSTKCNEADALSILIKEGCTLNADLIVITEEKRPSLWSSCYRCRAEFYKYRDSTVIFESDSRYDNNQLEKRMKKDRRKNTGIVIALLVPALVIIGFAIF